MDSRTKPTYPVTLLSLFIIIMTLATFYPIKNHEFIDYDDDNYVTANPHVQGGLSWKGLTWAFTTNHVSNWHPITWITHMVDCELYGLSPKGPHLNNLLLHVANTLLLFLLLHHMTKRLWRAFFTAALFALHPLHVESVAWVAERKDVLSTFFGMLAIGAYVRYIERPGLKYYLTSLVFFALSLMSKPMLVTLPFLLLLLDYWPLGRFRFDTHVTMYDKKSFPFLAAEKIPFFVMSIIMSAIAFFLQKGSGAMPSFISLKIRIANALVSYLTYVEKMFWPQNLAVFYPHRGPLLSTWEILLSGALLLIITVLVFQMRRRRGYLTFGWLWYLGTLVPVIGVVQIGMQAMADRYTYIPLIGPFVMISWGAYDILKGWRHHRPFLAITGGLIIALLITCAYGQIGYWKNTATLFEHALKVTKGNYLAHNNLGLALAEEGKFEEAAKHFTEALRINPMHVYAHNNLGLVLTNRGRYGEAEKHFREAIRIRPDFYEAHNNLGRVQARQKKYHKAAGHYAEALRINPEYVQALSNLGILLAVQGEFEQATKPLEKALRIRPDFLAARVNLGSVLIQSGNLEQGLQHLQKVLEEKPDSPQAHFSMGLAYTLMDKRALAMGHYEMLKSMDPVLADKLLATIRR